MGFNKKGVVMFRKGDDVSKVKAGTTKLIIHKSVKNVPQGHEEFHYGKSAFPGRETIKEIVIEEGVESIEKYSFSQCEKVKTIIFPSTLIEIGEGAFYECTNLEEVDLSKTKITQINIRTFYLCYNLNYIILPSTITKIGQDAFNRCTNLEEVDLSNTKITHTKLKDIGERAFNECTNLEEIDLSDTKVTHINKETFRSCKHLKTTIFPSTLIEIGEKAFFYCVNLEEVDLSNTKITHIKKESFYSCKNLKTIIFPSTLTVIGEWVFGESTNLEEIDLFKTEITHINKKTFYQCENLKSFIFPSTLIDIGEEAFCLCENLEEVDLSNTEITHIHKSTFYQCEKLKSIIFPSTLIDIGEEAFCLCENLEEVDLSNTEITHIHKSTFYQCEKLKSIIFPSTLIEIGEYAFLRCTNLTTLNIPASVELIEYGAFAYCGKLNIVNFLSNDTKVHKEAFIECDALPFLMYKNNIKEDVNSIMERNKKKRRESPILSTPEPLLHLSRSQKLSSGKEEGGVVMFRDGDNVNKVKAGTKKLIIHGSVNKVPEGKKYLGSSFPGYESIEEIVIGIGLKSIGKYSFSTCKNLKSIIFPSTLTEIGEGAFFKCYNLEEVDLSKTKITHINESTYSCCGNLTTLIVPASVTDIEEKAFLFCKKLAVLKFLSETTKVHKDTFQGCDALPSFMYKNKIKSSTKTTENRAEAIPAELVITENVEVEQYRGNDIIRFVEVQEGVERIGEWAFRDCSSLESVQLPKSLRDVDDGVFAGCTSLQEVNIPENVTVVNGELFHKCFSLKKVELSTSTTEIKHRAIYNCKSLENIELPQTLEVIEYGAFENCKSLKKIKIPKSVKELGWGVLSDGSVFSHCTSLEEVIFEKDSEIKIIETKTFYQCSSLREIELPSAVTDINDHAFSECISLKSIKIHDNITTIGQEAFSGCTSLESIRIPSSVTEICESTFKNCTSLTSLTIPRSVNKIEKHAFRDCNSLREVKIHNPDIEIGEGAFAGCGALENIRGLPSSEENIKSFLDSKVFEGCLSLENIIGNEIHLAAEGKSWKEDDFPQYGHLWIQQALEIANEKKVRKDASFMKDYNGNTAFWCAVRGGAPNEYLKVLAQGENKDSKTHLDIFADKYARKKTEDFTADELSFLIELNSKLAAATSIGKGRNYINSLEELLQSPIFDPRKVPEFIHILNKKFKSKVFVFLIMLEFIFPVMRIISFLMISDVYFNDDEDRVAKAHIVWFVLMYVSIGYLTIREFFQIQLGFLEYFTDILNWYDMFIIITTTLATIKMHTTDYVEEEENYWMKSFIIFTTFNIWMYAIHKTKVLSVNFAKFVSGIINIISTLVPFFLVSIFMLGAFAHMYFINNRTSGTYPDFLTSFQQTYSNLLTFDGLPFYNTVDISFESTTVVLNEANSKNKIEMTISYFFGIFVVILLSNVLIAVLSATWEDVSERGRDKFLLYRVRLLLETQIVFDIFDKIDKKLHSITSNTSFWSLSPDANYCEMWGESKKFSEVLRRMNLLLFGRIILNIIYTVLGIFFGLTWPAAVREALFCIDNSEAIADKRNRLQTRLRETKKEFERLRKIDKHISKKPDDIYAYLSECDGIPSQFQLKKKILLLEKQVKKQTKDVENFKNWEEDLKEEYNKEKVD